MDEIDLDETARLVLMELGPSARLIDFAKGLREVHGATLGIVEIGRVWAKYHETVWGPAQFDYMTGDLRVSR